MKKIIIRICAILVLLVIVALVAIFFSLNSIVKKGVETIGPKLTRVDVRLDAVDISPFSGSGKLTKLFVGNPKEFKTAYAAQMNSIKVGVQIGSVMSDTIVINEVNIQSPEIQFDGGLSGNNLSTILNNLKSASGSSGTTNKAAPAPTEEKKEKKFIVKDFVLQGAKIHLNITGLGIPMSETVPIPDIHMQNLGVAEGGLTAAQLGEKLAQPIYDSAYNAAANLASSAVKGVGNLGSGTANQVTNLESEIGGLFKKKQPTNPPQ
jgi:hypothetical protein